jgi:hypothetical protein
VESDKVFRIRWPGDNIMTPNPSQPRSAGSQFLAQDTASLPEPSFWTRYSPRSEFPLSSGTSIVLHGFLIGLLILTGMFLIKADENAEPLAVTAIAIGDPQDGNDPGGSEGGVPELHREQIDRANGTPFVPAASETLRQPIAVPPELPPVFTDSSNRIIDDAGQAVRESAEASAKARADIARQQTSRKGAAGNPRPRGQLLDERIKRMDRWVMTFETRDGNDYVRQLDALGAIVALPLPDKQYFVIRDLKQRPAKGNVEDVAQIQRVFWIDDKPESVRALAVALQFKGVPPFIVAFFPEQLEKELLDKELRYRNRREEDIRKTFFRLERKGGGYEARVVDQWLLPVQPK